MKFCKVDRCIKTVDVSQTCFEGCSSIRFQLFRLCCLEIEGRDDIDEHRMCIDQMILSSPIILRNMFKRQSHLIYGLQKRNCMKLDFIARLRLRAENISNLDGDKLLSAQAHDPNVNAIVGVA